ncbi:hypothetical protein ACJ2A9_13180 [Anaerobacillus sp. MEB173]|uniref:hypothetical protein n=1 Tax=Anaerobacillus sp. MEB173 TaxID=3383345 RepID=UPI003F93255D
MSKIMNKNKIGYVFIAFIAMFLSVVMPQPVTEASLMQSFSVKITVIDKGVEHEWEYHSPSKYEYETGETVIKNEKAKTEVEKMMKLLNISEKATVEEMVDSLKKNGFETIERLDVRWMNGESQLYTWVWENDQREK